LKKITESFKRKYKKNKKTWKKSTKFPPLPRNEKHSNENEKQQQQPTPHQEKGLAQIGGRLHSQLILTLHVAHHHAMSVTRCIPHRLPSRRWRALKVNL
jgi:hypothetical protein